LPFFFVVPFFFAGAPARGLVVVVTVTLPEDEAAAAPRVDLIGRLVAMELVFSDMRERYDKRGSSMKEQKVSRPHSTSNRPIWVGPRNGGK
jgi:hypothetical protein